MFEKNKTHSIKSPIWASHASAVNWTYNNVLKNQNSFQDIEHRPFCKIPEGMRMMMIISIASVIEGILRSYLLERVSLSPKFKTKQFVIRIIKIKTKTRLPSSEQVEGYEWGRLLKVFKQIENTDFKSALSIQKNIEFYHDLNMLFKFRNFIVHSNDIKEDYLEKRDGNISFYQNDNSKTLKDYLKRKKFGLVDETDTFFVEQYFTEKLIEHFIITMNDFIKLNIFKQSMSMNNFLQLICL